MNTFAWLLLFVNTTLYNTVWETVKNVNDIIVNQQKSIQFISFSQSYFVLYKHNKGWLWQSMEFFYFKRIIKTNFFFLIMWERGVLDIVITDTTDLSPDFSPLALNSKLYRKKILRMSFISFVCSLQISLLWFILFCIRASSYKAVLCLFKKKLSKSISKQFFQIITLVTARPVCLLVTHR